MTLFQFFLRQHLIAFDFFMTCSNCKSLTSNSECENWTWGQWELRTVQSEQPDGKQPAMELSAWESNPCAAVCTKHLFLKVWKRAGGIVDRKGGLQGWGLSERLGASSAFISPTNSYTLNTSQQLQNLLTGKSPTQIFIAFWANPITSGEVSDTGNGNDNLQWLRTPWVTATISFWWERGMKKGAAADGKGSVPLRENIFPSDSTAS